jgi:hypothetical protein
MRLRLRYAVILVRCGCLVSSKSTLWRRHAVQSAMCNVRNVKCNVQTGVLAVQGLSASVPACILEQGTFDNRQFFAYLRRSIAHVWAEAAG